MDFKKRAKELVSKMTLAEKCAQLRFDAPAIERLGVMEYNWWNECLHGVARSGVATVFPQAIGMAASFDPSLMNEVASAISDEARAKYNEYKKKGSTGYYEGLTFWSPNINIFRDPRWGRGHETYGEDPYLTGVIGSAFVKGLQDGDSTYRKLDATIKHYAVHSGPEGTRHSFDAKVGKKDLYETYLRAFKMCIDSSDPSAVMGAYNRVSIEDMCEGEPCCGSETLLQKILYKEMGFDGYVVSDCGAINDFHMFHKITNNAAESAALALKNGCALNCGSAYRAMLAAIDSGLVNEDDVTKAVESLFYARFRLGMFDDDCPFNSISYDVVDCDKHREVNLKMAYSSVVVLKNNGILPLSKDSDKTIAVIGPNADNLEVLLGNYNGTPSEYFTVLDGIRSSYKGKVRYTPGGHIYKEYNKESCGENLLDDVEIIASKSDVIILVMGLNASMEGEDGDAYNGAASGDKITLDLPRAQYQIYDRVIKLGKPVIFINMTGSAMNLSRQDDECDAVVQVFYPGAMGGKAVADILFGDVNPSGRLPVTFYHSDSDLPPFDDYSMKNRTYRYFEGTPLYPFGHGLTYTDFEHEKISSPSEIKSGENIKISVSVKNNSDFRFSGEESIPVYVRYPDVEAAPKKSLCAIGRISLKSGESGIVDIEIKASDTALYDDTGAMIYPKGKMIIETDKASAEINVI